MYRNADGSSSSPHGNQKVRLKARFDYLRSKGIRVSQQLIRSNNIFVFQHSHACPIPLIYISEVKYIKEPTTNPLCKKSSPLTILNPSSTRRFRKATIPTKGR